MSSDETQAAGSAEPRSPEEIEADLERTRRDLAETVDALSAKMDVKSRAREQVVVTKQRVSEKAQETREKASEAVRQGKDAATDDSGTPKPMVLVGAGVAALLALGAPILINRRRRRSRPRVVELARKR